MNYSIIKQVFLSRSCRILLHAGLLLSLAGCASGPPRDINNICSIFDQKNKWYQAALESQKQWGTPIHVQMAIMWQESSFRDDAQPERSKIFGFIPWTRPSSAYGYPQAKDETWDWYKKKTGNRGADRDDFDDAIDFIGWYTNYSHRTLGISKWDAYRQYLAYHEGHGGYKQKTYRKKNWLQTVSRNVDNQSKRYAKQLKRCESSLDKGWSLWPF